MAVWLNKMGVDDKLKSHTDIMCEISILSKSIIKFNRILNNKKNYAKQRPDLYVLRLLNTRLPGQVGLHWETTAANFEIEKIPSRKGLKILAINMHQAHPNAAHSPTTAKMPIYTTSGTFN